jgi:hypothetical protein
MKRGYFLGCNSNIWATSINNLTQQGIKFDYVSGIPEALDQLTIEETATKHHVRDLERGILPTEINESDFPALDEKILSLYRDIELTCFDMADRMDTGYTFSYQERLRHYLKMLAFWLYKIEVSKPDFIVFQQTPHSVDSFILLGICRQNNIPTISFLPITPLELVIPLTDFQLGLKQVQKLYLNYSEKTYLKAKKNMPEYLEEYLGKLSRSYAEAIPPYLAQRLEHAQSLEVKNKYFNPLRILRKLRNPKNYGEYSLRLFKLLLEKSQRTTTPHAPGNNLKRAGEPLEKSRLTGKEWIQYKQQAAQFKLSLKATYDSYCSEFNADTPYIYVALHYQPERTSTPEGGRFTNQLLMVKMLAKHLPKGWKIIIKENPTQLLPYTLHGERGRYHYFYDDLLRIPCVEFVKIETPQFELIDSAKAVATISGTTGWESCVRGVPVLIFGEAWYKGCEGIFYCGENGECREAIETISNDFEIDIKKVYYFLFCLYQSGFRGYLNPKRYKDPIKAENSDIHHAITKMLSVHILGSNS